MMKTSKSIEAENCLIKQSTVLEIDKGIKNVVAQKIRNKANKMIYSIMSIT